MVQNQTVKLIILLGKFFFKTVGVYSLNINKLGCSKPIYVFIFHRRLMDNTLCGHRTFICCLHRMLVQRVEKGPLGILQSQTRMQNDLISLNAF